MYELTPDGLVTSDPQIAVLFLGERIKEGTLVDIYFNGFTVNDGGEYVHHNRTAATIPRPLVKALLEPVEGEQSFGWSGLSANVQPPPWVDVTEHFTHFGESAITINALTTGKTVGELRELVSWAGQDER